MVVVDLIPAQRLNHVRPGGQKRQKGQLGPRHALLLTPCQKRPHDGHGRHRKRPACGSRNAPGNEPLRDEIAVHQKPLKARQKPQRAGLPGPEPGGGPLDLQRVDDQRRQAVEGEGADVGLNVVPPA